MFSQTFVNLKYIQKLEISYEYHLHLIFTPIQCTEVLLTTKHASAAALIHRQQTLYWLFTRTKLSSIYRNKPIVTNTYTYWALMKPEALLTIQAKLKLAIIFFLLFCREILESVWQEEENFEVLTRNISKYIQFFLLCHGKAVNLLHL